MKNNLLRLVIIVCLLNSCRDTYRAGSGSEYLRFPIETRLDPMLIMNYLDTSTVHRVPKDLNHTKLLLDELAPDQNKKVYFSEAPREVYLISVGGMTRLSAVLEPEGIDGKWITDPTEISLHEKTRIMNRLYLFLSEVESKAKQKGLPDSVIYFQDPFKRLQK